MPKPEYIGLAYDFVEDVVIDRSPVIRATAAEALADAKALCATLRLSDAWVAVQGPHGIEDEDAIADREYDDHVRMEQERAEGRLPGYDDTPSLPDLPAY